MLESVYYENTKGEKIDLRSKTLLANFRTARPFSYSIANDFYTNKGKDFSMVILSLGRQNIDKLISVLHYDVISEDFGKLYINGWYIKCRYSGIGAISHESRGFVKVEIMFHAPSILWTRGRKYELISQSTFQPQDALNSGDNYLDTGYDFDLDYANSGDALKIITNYEEEPADVIIKIKATGSKFSLNISGEDFENTYKINTQMKDSLLIINSETKKVTLNGQDVFLYAWDLGDIFRKIPKGTFICSWTPIGYDLEIELLEHRSVPLWII